MTPPSPRFRRRLLGVLLTLSGCLPPGDPELEVLPLGGEVELPSSEGTNFRLSERSEEVKLLYFGYTYCPDACPLTLVRIGEVERKLGSKRSGLLTVFVSVDPERDSPERLKEWLAFFGVRGVGLVGTPEEVERVAKLFGVHFEKAALESAAGYLVDHTTYLFLLDKRGRVRRLIESEVEADRITGWVEKLLAEPS